MKYIVLVVWSMMCAARVSRETHMAFGQRAPTEKTLNTDSLRAFRIASGIMACLWGGLLVWLWR